MKITACLFGGFVALILTTACSDDETKTGPAAPTPTVTITEPKDMDTVTITTTPDVEIDFTVTNFTLKDKGACAGASACGHVHSFVNDHDCDDHEAGEMNPFNHEAGASPVEAGFDYCPGVMNGIPAEGAYVVKVGLFTDNETAVITSTGSPIEDSISIKLEVNAQGGGGAGPGGGGAGGTSNGGAGGMGGTSNGGAGGMGGNGGN